MATSGNPTNVLAAANSAVTSTATTLALSLSPSAQTVSPGSSIQFTASGGTAPYYYSVVSGGGTINSSNGLYTAPSTPTTNCTQNPISISVEDHAGTVATAQVCVSVSNLTLTAASSSVATSSTLQFTASGGTPPYTYAVASGIGSINSSTGLYTSPGSSGTAQISATDSAGSVSYTTITVGFTINVPSDTIAINSTVQITATGSTSYTYAIVSGGGTISATGLYTAPATPGSVEISVTDAAGATLYTTLTIDNLTMTEASTHVAVNSTLQFTASGGTTPYSFTLTPSGFGTISSSGLYKAPATSGTVKITVTDANGATVTSPLITVSNLAISAASYSIPISTSVQVTASGGTAPYTFSISSGPAGGSLSVVNSTSDIYHAPASDGTAVIGVTDATGVTAYTPPILVGLVISAPTTTIAASTSTKSSTLQFKTVGGTPPYAYSVKSGPGTINASGLYTSPTTSGAATIQVTDSLGGIATIAITITNSLSLSEPTTSIPSSTSGTASTLQFTASGGSGSYTYSISPSNFGSINSSGLYTAPVGSNGAVVITVTDSTGAKVSSPTISVGLASTFLMGVNATLTFTPNYGTSPYSFAITSGIGTITVNSNNLSAVYTSPATTGSAVITITDSKGVTNTTKITIDLGLSTTSIAVANGGTLVFTASGGTAPYTYALVAGGAGGSINSSSGVYTAPATGTGAVSISATDSVGTVAYAVITVGPEITTNNLGTGSTTAYLANWVGGDACYASGTFTSATPSAAPYLMEEFPSPVTVSTVHLIAASGGFPTNYTIYVTDQYNSQWIPLQTIATTGTPAAGSTVNDTLGGTYTTWGIMIVANTVPQVGASYEFELCGLSAD
ncbi:MAG: hypothetical protein P4M08_12935 [Oligoflexia bacterium]|nr:hypothetical protein [Oligoflexia bacterium]